MPKRRPQKRREEQAGIERINKRKEIQKDLIAYGMAYIISLIARFGVNSMERSFSSDLVFWVLSIGSFIALFMALRSLFSLVAMSWKNEK